MRFTKKKLSAAVIAGIGAAAITGGQQAVAQNGNVMSLADEGVGQVLIYPYYTVREDADGNAFNTYVSITNTTDSVKFVKVRFREGLNSHEVLDFQLFLSPFDMWTGALVRTANGAQVISRDESCTVPDIPVSGVELRTSTFDELAEDPIGGGGPVASLKDRTREGYVEVFEMATLTSGTSDVVHAAQDGDPLDCSAVQSLNPTAGMTEAAPSGGLYGTGTMINVDTGVSYPYDAVAIKNFSDGEIIGGLGTQLPNLGSGNRQALVFADTQQDADDIPEAVLTQYSGPRAGVNAVSALFMHDTVSNDFILDPTTESRTEWVLTHPTKNAYVNSAPPVPPFSDTFTAIAQGASNDGACEPVNLSVWNREEEQITGGVDFSPQEEEVSSICWETNVVAFDEGAVPSSLFGSKLMKNVPTNFDNGWMRLEFIGDNATNVGLREQGQPAETYFGLPVTGFMAQDYFNGRLSVGGGPRVLSTYGNTFEHKLGRDIRSGQESGGPQ